MGVRDPAVEGAGGPLREEDLRLHQAGRSPQVNDMEMNKCSEDKRTYIHADG